MQLGALATGRSGSGAQMQVGVAATGRGRSGALLQRDGDAAGRGCGGARMPLVAASTQLPAAPSLSLPRCAERGTERLREAPLSPFRPLSLSLSHLHNSSSPNNRPPLTSPQPTSSSLYGPSQSPHPATSPCNKSLPPLPATSPGFELHNKSHPVQREGVFL
jgi:hypothetical protein